MKKSKDIFVQTLLAICLISCASADLEIRDDRNPSPMDLNHHTMLMQATCGPQLAMGQAGCSLASVDEAKNHNLTIYSPLGGKITMYSRGCHVDKTVFVKEGGKFDFNIGDLVPPDAKFCTFDLFMYWEKPATITTEVPVRGQSGKFYLRIRPNGVAPASLSWTPQQGVITAGAGILFSQFREIAAKETREPVLLKIKTSSPVDAGKYQLWNEPLQIGVKGTFTGDEISVPAEKILGPAKQGSFILGGFAINSGMQMSFLDNDFFVAVDIFGWKSSKVAGLVEITEKEVCFQTENVVSLVVLTGVDKASNKVEDCFPRPTSDAIMAFYTNVGRSAYAVIKGDQITWIQ